jgi:hypothetical protein
MKFENVSSQKSGRSIVIDFQMMNIHTDMYVISSDGTHDGFSNIVERVLDLS